jgi:DNA helicase-2/ATP-dependent DNA helicase PcrA
LFPHQRSLDESGRAGLEEERRLAYVGVTRARLRAKIIFASNRRIHGLWQTTVPSRFIDDLPADHVQLVENARSGSDYGGYAQSRFANMDQFGSKYETPGWRRAQQRAGEAPVKKPTTIEGEVVGRAETRSGFAPGVRVFHTKFGPGAVAAVDGGKLTIDFDKAGRKLVLDSFVERRD